MLFADSREHIREVIEDPSTPRWVPRLLDELKDKDPVDVANALQVLVDIYDQRCRELSDPSSLTSADIIRRLIQVDSEYGVLHDRVSSDAFSGVLDFMRGLLLKVREHEPATPTAVAISAFTLGYDYHRTFGELPR